MIKEESLPAHLLSHWEEQGIQRQCKKEEDGLKEEKQEKKSAKPIKRKGKTRRGLAKILKTLL